MPIVLKKKPRVYVWGERGDWRIFTLPEQIQIGPVCLTRKEAADLAAAMLGDSRKVESFHYFYAPSRRGFGSRSDALQALLASSRPVDRDRLRG
jgi:hypothetical protein